MLLYLDVYAGHNVAFAFCRIVVVRSLHDTRHNVAHPNATLMFMSTWVW